MGRIFSRHGVHAVAPRPAPVKLHAHSTDVDRLPYHPRRSLHAGPATPAQQPRCRRDPPRRPGCSSFDRGRLPAPSRLSESGSRRRRGSAGEAQRLAQNRSGRRSAKGEDATAIMAEGAAARRSCRRARDSSLDEVQSRMQALLLTTPNVPHESVPVGQVPR